MKVAIVVNNKRRTSNVLEKRITLWAVQWENLCIANSIEYKIFDSFDPDFIDKLVTYYADRTLWRSIGNTLMKFKDESQRMILDRSGLRIVPNWQTHYLYDHKIRQSYLFKLHDIPHPETKVCFNEPYALEYIEKVKYPFVVKADGGAGGKSFRFIETKEQALEIVDNIFHKRGKWSGREHEKSVLYAQEYIPANGVWRIWMFLDKVAVGMFVNNAVGTLKASGSGKISYLPVPSKVLNMAMNINRGMLWDWCMYDIIWCPSRKKYLVLEVTDTVPDRDQKNRKETIYREGNDWIPKPGKLTAPEIIFNLFILEEMRSQERLAK